MNPNFDAGNGGEQEPDPQDQNEGAENEMSFSTADYPELDGLQQGAPVKVTCNATVSQSDQGSVVLAIEPGSCQFEMEGQADRAMKQMSHQDNAQPQENAGGDDF